MCLIFNSAVESSTFTRFVHTPCVLLERERERERERESERDISLHITGSCCKPFSSVDGGTFVIRNIYVNFVFQKVSSNCNQFLLEYLFMICLNKIL